MQPPVVAAAGDETLKRSGEALGQFGHRRNLRLAGPMEECRRGVRHQPNLEGLPRCWWYQGGDATAAADDAVTRRSVTKQFGKQPQFLSQLATLGDDRGGHPVDGDQLAVQVFKRCASGDSTILENSCPAELTRCGELPQPSLAELPDLVPVIRRDVEHRGDMLG